MNISYSQQAKNDLVKIHWKARNNIISGISKYQTVHNTNELNLRPLSNTDFHKFDFQGHIAISKIDENQINILTVIEKKRIKLPE
jgi:hypothetical protein